MPKGSELSEQIGVSMALGDTPDSGVALSEGLRFTTGGDFGDLTHITLADGDKSLTVALWSPDLVTFLRQAADAIERAVRHNDPEWWAKRSGQ